MSKQKPSIPKGTRDFSPMEMSRRNYIFDTIREVFRTYGFSQIETPAMENLSTLLGKYGEEGDKLLFRILNSGDFMRGVNPGDAGRLQSLQLASHISKRGLRYDLTVPFARFVVQHRNEITFPFRRFQIQPVWRADNPQKGRYREFYQCDADMIGTVSLLNEFELLKIIDQVFDRLQLKVVIKLNNRKVLAGIAEVIGEPDRMTEITVAIDKLDKIGKERVKAELLERGISEASAQKLDPVFNMTGSTAEKLEFLDRYLAESATGRSGISELRQILTYLESDPVACDVELDLTLARGLNYYTGAIIEVKTQEASMGSICGGGRYDDLTGIFGMPDVSGVGISFGADRIYDVLLQLDRFPDSAMDVPHVLFVNFGEQEVNYILPILGALRAEGIACELYPEAAKMKKQMSYANDRKVPYVALAGEQEMEAGMVTIKKMETGEQDKLSKEDLVQYIKE